MDRLRLEYATDAFLRAARKQHAKRFPDKHCPIKRLEDYSSLDRSSLMAAVGAAIVSTQANHDLFYREWLENRADRMSDDPAARQS